MQYHLLSTENDVLQRIPPILEKHFHGIWSWQLEADYVDRFHEQLPTNWLEIVDMSPCISVERCLDDKYVLRFCKPEEVKSSLILNFVNKYSNWACQCFFFYSLKWFYVVKWFAVFRKGTN